MGNRHVESQPIHIINPTENPYLYVIKGRNENGLEKWDYAAHLSGMQLGVAVETRRNDKLKIIDHLASFDIPLLPPIVTAPPPPMDAKEIVEKALYGIRDSLIEAMTKNPDANLLTFAHGYAWGLYPINVTAKLLEGIYYVNSNGVFQIGGRKKYQVNAAHFQRI